MSQFIVIEGLDGSGKSTQIQKLQDFFEQKGIPSKFIHFPMLNQGIYGDLIAAFLRGDFGTIENVHPQLVALLFANDRKEHIHLIENWLREGYYVLADRYVYSNVAFQCAKLKHETEAKALHHWILNYEYQLLNLPKPDISVFLDVPFEIIESNLKMHRTGEDRDYLNGKKDIHENALDFQLEVYKQYKNLSQTQEDLIALDCSDPNKGLLSIEAVHQKILSFLKL
jgi:dTMP kinase